MLNLDHNNMSREAAVELHLIMAQQDAERVMLVLNEFDVLSERVRNQRVYSCSKLLHTKVD